MPFELPPAAALLDETGVAMIARPCAGEGRLLLRFPAFIHLSTFRAEDGSRLGPAGNGPAGIENP